MNELAFCNTEFIASIFDGIEETEINILCGLVYGSMSKGKDYVKNDISFLSDCASAISEDCQRRFAENLRNIQNGVRSERYESIKRKINEEKNARYRDFAGVTFGEQNEMEVVKVWAEYFKEPRNINYSPEEDLFYRKCKKAFESGKTLSVAIPHCVDILDAEKNAQGKYFILLRDPFNIYNYEYTGTSDNMETTNEGFECVISGREANRHLSGNAQDMIHAGFRGTSWVELKDLYARIRGVYAPEF